MERNIAKLKKGISQIQGESAAKKAEHDRLNKELEKAEDERISYRSDSRFAAMWTGFVIGVVLALIGVRVLGNIFSDEGLSEIQNNIFVMADILFTGFILAGGSEAIHKIMKVYSSFTKKVEARNLQH